jgi:hypothetical protein
MRARSWTAAHDRLLAEAAPPVPERSDADLDLVWRQVEGGLVTERQPRRRRKRLVVGAIAAALLLGTSVAAADVYTSHTGKGPSDAEDLSLGGPGERLDSAAPDFGKAVAEATEDIPFPDASSRAFAVQDQVHDFRFATPRDTEMVSTGAIRAWVADAALCSWSNQWAAATRSNDDAGRLKAITMIQAAPGWPAVTAIDPKPYSRMATMEIDDGDGHIVAEQYPDDSQFFYLAALGQAVEGRNPEAVAEVLAKNNGYCRPALVPDLPNADPRNAER